MRASLLVGFVLLAGCGDDGSGSCEIPKGQFRYDLVVTKTDALCATRYGYSVGQSLKGDIVLLDGTAESVIPIDPKCSTGHVVASDDRCRISTTYTCGSATNDASSSQVSSSVDLRNPEKLTGTSLLRVTKQDGTYCEVTAELSEQPLN